MVNRADLTLLWISRKKLRGKGAPKKIRTKEEAGAKKGKKR